MRHLPWASRLALPVLVVPALLVLPVAAPGPAPVAPELHTVSLASAAPAGLSALRAATTDLHLPARRTEDFSVVGVTWAPQATRPDVDVSVRTRALDGTWSAWRDLHGQSDDAPDDDTADLAAAGVRVGTRPAYVGPSDGVEVAVEVLSGRAPKDLRVDLVDPGSSPADAGVRRPGTAYAASSQPAIVTREQWGADESIKRCSSGYTGTPRVSFVHHTASTNDYTREQAPAAVRGFYAYHVKSNGWCDLGYNFLVDKYGVIYEGRAGGIDRAVLGAHTGGFNSNSFGTAMIGTFQSVSPSTALRASLARLLAWKLGTSYADPNGKAQLTAAGGGSRFAGGSTVTFDVVSGHRDAVNTTCPGELGYGALRQVRADVAAEMGTSLVGPRATPTSVEPDAGTPVQVTAGLTEPASWRLEVRDEADALVGAEQGTATELVETGWDLRDASGAPAVPGRYLLSLTATGASTALPWTSTVTVKAPPAPSPTPAPSPGTGAAATPAPSPTSALPAGARFVPLTPRRVLDTRASTGPRRTPLTAGETFGLALAGTAGIPSEATAVALNLTATQPTSGTHLTVFPRGATRPETAVLNLRAGATAASLVVAGLGTAGATSIYNLAGEVHVVADVVGYWTRGSGAGYTPLTPARLLDTRSAAGGARRIADQETLTVGVRGRGGVPSSATGVVLNVTAVGPQAGGFLTVSPQGTRTGTSSVNYATGQTVPNRVVTGLSSTGAIDLFAAGSTHALVDVVGWFGPGDGALRALTPSRLLDSRLGTGTTRARFGERETREVQVTGTAGVPAGASAVVLSLTSVGPTASQGFVTAWGADTIRPGTSDLNTLAGETRSNLAVVPLSPEGRLALYNESGTVHLVADVLGYIAS